MQDLILSMDVQQLKLLYTAVNIVHFCKQEGKPLADRSIFYDSNSAMNILNENVNIFHPKKCIRVFIQALFIIVHTGNQPNIN